jgi:hypothetical protein
VNTLLAMKNFAPVRWRQLLVALGASLGVALLLNWGILKLFGQKSAERAEHSLIGIVLLMAYVWRFLDRQETRLAALTFFLLALIPCYLGTAFPDLDITLLGIGAHRNPLFHSGLSFFALWWLVRRRSPILQAAVLGYGVGLASHLFWDTWYFGDVRWLPGGMVDRLWLTGNGVACLVPLLARSHR